MSDYLAKLLQAGSPDIAIRYRQKISVVNNIDPLSLSDSDFSTSPVEFPKITNMDIITYLVFTTSSYTSQQLKAYKSLNAFKYFKAGFVSNCGSLRVADHVIIKAKVKHSQRMNIPPLQCWAICKIEGDIVSAHCTCMAGAGEVCSHVGALLFAVESISTSAEGASCTDVASGWNVPTKVKQVEYKPVKEIDFGRKIIFSSLTSPTGKVSVVNVLKDIEEAGSSSVLMRVVEPFATKIAESMENKIKAPHNPFGKLYQNRYEASSHEELLSEAQKLMISITREECDLIETSTRNQSKSNEWFCQRTGRITASKFKQVCCTKLEKPSLSLVKSICYPLKFQFRSKATDWGLQKENVALESYENFMNQSHNDLTISKIGLIVSEEYPQFGASPDGIVDCSCCGRGCIEIKCPFLLKNTSLDEFAMKKGTCLEEVEGNLTINTKHAYFYQMQQQMALTKTLYCDFVVWSPTEFFVQRILFNEDFWWSESAKSLEFHKRVIMPELLGRFYTKTSLPIETWCICKMIDDGRPMIECGNGDCDVKWYHMDCLNLEEVPDTLWLCPSCME